MIQNFEVISIKFSTDTICTLSSSHEKNKITILIVTSVELNLRMSSAQNSHGFPTQSVQLPIPQNTMPHH